MKKKLVLFVLLLLCAALSFSVGVLAFSRDNLANRAAGRVSTVLGEESVAKIGDTVCLFLDGEEVSVAFGITPLTHREEVGYLSNLRLTFADGAAIPAEATVFYKDGTSAVLPLGAKNNDFYLTLRSEGVSRIVYEGDLPTLAEANPTRLHVNVFWVFLLFLAPLMIGWSVIEALFDRTEFKKDVVSLKRYRYLLYDLVGRDLKTKYRRSALGLLWSVLNPLLMMLVLTAVFSNIMRVEVEGGFALFYLTGYIMFNFVSESTNMSLSSVYYASGLIKKVYLPKYVFPLEKSIFSFVNMLFSLIAFVIVFVVFAISGKVAPHATMLLFPLPMLYLFVFSLGLSLVLSAVYIFFRDVGHIWGVLLTVWMYASPVIYPVSILPAWLASLMKLNPLYHYITYFRGVMLYGTLPSFADNAVCLLFALAMLGFGITVFRKSQDKFILYI